MTDPPHDEQLSGIPEAVVEPKRRFNLQLVWLIPIVAAIIGGALAVRTYLNQGPTITITFKTGEGLEAGKTKIKYKDVEIGVVKEVVIAGDLKQVIATAELKKDVTPYLVEDTKFWIVKAQISGGSITGLGTLMGGSYIGVDVGTSRQARSTFQGLEAPPVVTMDVPGNRFKLHSQELGSLDIGSPLYFRGLKVGQVLSYELDQDGKGVTFKVFVAAPYDKYVNASSRFWNASGIDLSMDANGLKVNTQSLVSIMVGGIAFQTLDDKGDAPPTDPNFAFTLSASREEAMKQVDSISYTYVMVFKESVRGLSVGAPVDFRGVIIGEVTAVNMEYDPHNKELNMLVEARTYPERIRARQVGSVKQDPGHPRFLTDLLIEKGLRAQLKSGSMVTGQLYVSLDFFPKAPKARIDWAANPPQFPTMPSSLVELQATFDRIINKFEKLPLNEVVSELRQAVQSLDQTLQSTNSAVKKIDGEIVPEVRTTLEETRKTLEAARQNLATDAPLQQDLRETLRELGRAAQSMKTLTDYLERHPESLIRGKAQSGAKGE
jgi:paraquat-inducible protein B